MTWYVVVPGTLNGIKMLGGGGGPAAAAVVIWRYSWTEFLRIGRDLKNGFR